jgi:hypothetical protein
MLILHGDILASYKNNPVASLVKFPVFRRYIGTMFREARDFYANYYSTSGGVAAQNLRR